MEPALVALLRRLDLVPRGKADVDRSKVIVQSFDLGSLQAVKRLAPSLPTAWLWVAPPPEAPADGTLPAGVDVMAPTDTAVLANPGLVAVVHTDGGAVHTWTVDDPAEMEQLLDLGVDGIFTNQPDVLRAIVDRRTGHAARPAVDRAAGCPGVAGTVTAVSTGRADGCAGASARHRRSSPPPTRARSSGARWRSRSARSWWWRGSSSGCSGAGARSSGWASLLGLLSAGFFGSGDFLGGRASRDAPTPAVLFVVQLSAAIARGRARVRRSRGSPIGDDLAFGAAAGGRQRARPRLPLPRARRPAGWGSWRRSPRSSAAVIPVTWGLLDRGAAGRGRDRRGRWSRSSPSG